GRTAVMQLEERAVKRPQLRSLAPLLQGGGRVLPPATSRAALRPDVAPGLRDVPSARTRGLRPASPALAGLLRWVLVSPPKGRFPREAMSEGARSEKSLGLENSATERPATA